MVAEKLKTLRKASGKIQKEVERDTGVNMGYVEAVCVDPSIRTIERLCRYYGITQAEFFEDIDL